VDKTLVEQYVEDPSNMRLFQQGRAMMEVTCLLERVMERKGVKRSQLAQLLGRTKFWMMKETIRSARLLTSLQFWIIHSIFLLVRLQWMKSTTPILVLCGQRSMGRPSES